MGCGSSAAVGHTKSDDLTEYTIEGDATYVLKKCLNSGSYSQVWRCQSGATTYACKVIRKEMFDNTPKLVTWMKREIDALRMMNHVNIIKLVEVCVDAA
jgi:serine/threonine protein kinase